MLNVDLFQLLYHKTALQMKNTGDIPCLKALSTYFYIQLVAQNFVKQKYYWICGKQFGSFWDTFGGKKLQHINNSIFFCNSW